MIRAILKAALVLALPLAAGCASTSADGAFRDVAAEVTKRTGQKVIWNQGREEDAEVERAVQSMLKRELAVDAAVQIALLNNRHLQAAYEDLSVAQADLVQAGLLKNPAFEAAIKFPLAGGGAPKIDLGVEQSFLSLLLLPARKKLAAAELTRAKLRVGGAVIDLASEVRVAYFTLQGALHITAMRRTILDAAQTASELAARQSEAGTLSDLDLASEQGMFEQVRLDVARSEGEVLEARERLTRLMGLWGAKASWSIADKLPDPPPADPPLDHLESMAIRQRLDIAAGREQVQIAAHALSIAGSGRFLGGLDVGASVEKDFEEPWAVGPAARLELPIFDQGQAGIARLEAELRRSRHSLAALAVDARSEVRAARARLVLARATAPHYRTVLIPLRERIVALSQQQYDAMLLGVYQLLRVKRDEVETYREYIQAVRDYWIAWSELERAVGGRLPRPAAAEPAKQSPPASSSTTHEHHHP